MSTQQRNIIGIDGEAQVVRYLVNHGFTILARNYKKLYGEIDIIASKADVIAFVEVKTRTYHYLNQAEIITPGKQKKIIMTAHAFIASHDYHDKIYRFDVAFVTLVDGNMSVEYMDNAFNQKEY